MAFTALLVMGRSRGHVGSPVSRNFWKLWEIRASSWRFPNRGWLGTCARRAMAEPVLTASCASRKASPGILSKDFSRLLPPAMRRTAHSGWSSFSGRITTRRWRQGMPCQVWEVRWRTSAVALGKGTLFLYSHAKEASFALT